MDKDSLNPGKREEKKVLLVPAVSDRQGTGHLKRSLSLLDTLGDHTYLYIPAETALPGDIRAILNQKKNILRRLDRDSRWDLIILDKRATGKKEFGRFSTSGVLIGLDEGGGSRKDFPYLVDTLLNPLQMIKPNITASCFDFNGTVKNTSNSFQHVLISFGGEDSHDLSSTLVKALIQKNLFAPGELTIIQGPLFTQHEWPAGIKVIKNPPDLAGLITEYDLVFTHFGMTCFESIAKGVPVILFHPTSYHKKLGDFYHLPHIGIRKPCIKTLKRILAHPEDLKNELHAGSLLMHDHTTLPDLVTSLYPGGTTDCPVCGRTRNRIIERLPYKTFYTCRTCGVIYYQGFKNKHEKYDRNYFFEEYKKQYGKTYLEDFDTIKQIACKRLAVIKKIAGEKKSLLDVGCAYGPFLAAAQDKGFIAEGMDVSSDASAFVNTTLHIRCHCLDFSKITGEETGHKKYDIITMWFVLEHFIKTDVILRKVSRYMKRGGVFAFSTPNTSGISYKKNRKKYLVNNPDDHYTLWNPAAAKRILKRCGFKVIKIRITGHHPERFPGLSRKDGKEHKNKKGIVFSFLFFISRIFSLGDTFEVYARKVR